MQRISHTTHLVCGFLGMSHNVDRPQTGCCTRQRRTWRSSLQRRSAARLGHPTVRDSHCGHRQTCCNPNKLGRGRNADVPPADPSIGILAPPSRRTFRQTRPRRQAIDLTPEQLQHCLQSAQTTVRIGPFLLRHSLASTLGCHMSLCSSRTSGLDRDQRLARVCTRLGTPPCNTCTRHWLANYA